MNGDIIRVDTRTNEYLDRAQKGIGMKFDTEYIESLADLINQKGLSEISLEDGNQAITIRKEAGTVPVPVQQVAVAPQVAESPKSFKEKAVPAVKVSL